MQDPGRNPEQNCRLYDHFPGVPGERNPPFQRPEIQAGQKDFTGKHAAEVGENTESGDADQDKGNAQKQGRNILQKRGAGAAKSVQDASHGGCQVEKGAEPGEDLYVASGIFVVKYTGSQ